MAYPQASYRKPIRVAFLTTVIPVARRSGGEIAAMAFIEALQNAGHDVQVAGWLPPDAEEPDAGWVHAAGHRHIETAEAPATAKAAWLARAFAQGLPYSVAKYAGRRYDRAAAAARDGADLVVVNSAQAPAAVPEDRPFVHIEFNVEHDLYAAAAQRATRAPARRLLRREARLVERVERRLSDGARAVWCLTEADAARFSELGARAAPVFPVPGRTPAHVDAGGVRDGVALIGNWTWEPNAVGLRWFAAQVVPLLDRSLSVEVAGAGSEHALAEQPETGLRLHGRVPDADRFLAGARVVAVPAMAGGGIQVKTLDAIAAGAWVVTTPMGVRGLDDLPPSVRVESEPERFAAAIAELERAPESASPSAEGIDWSRRRAERFTAMVSDEAAAALGRG
ncbi:MAG: polysaccharide biosynthesis protein PslH [Thermoleophilaceae bacterium]|nr:polysaccharide biosynthesis protein PslH [Thermoleophilaceae bacterium]